MAKKGGAGGGYSACSAFSAVPVTFCRPAGPVAAREQLSLPDFGPDADDPFRFTWWNTADGARVWIEHRGRWCAGVVITRRRKYVEVAIVDGGGRRRRVRKPYSELRRAR